VAGGWAAWSNLASSPGAFTLSSIASPEGPQFRNYVSASDGKVWSLSGGGTPAWAATPAPWIGQIPQSLAFQGDRDGVTVTDLGGIFYTTDGGANWGTSYAHSKDKPRAVWMSRSIFGLGYIVADDGTILKTMSGGH
jgi:photosystem II stability/assembly factor-like uncharacterized protein